MATPSITRPQVATATPAIRRRRLTRDAPLGYGLLAPAAVLIVVLVGYPFVRALCSVPQEGARPAGRGRGSG